MSSTTPKSFQTNTSRKKLKITQTNKRPELKNSETTQSENERRYIVFLCGICDQKFARLKSLERHMKNIHSDYHYEFDREHKRKRNDPFLTDKKFIHDGRVKRKNRTEDIGHYKKRQKLTPKKQVIYQNFFE